MFKRYSGYSGGTCDPLVIHWPKGIKALECCGLTMPDVVDGVKQTPLPRVSMKYSFDNAKAGRILTAALAISGRSISF